jgi:cobalt-zinc-cadmium resistance protein CzcA
MLNKIINFSVKNKLIIGLMVIGLIIYGSYQATRLPIDAVPDITDNQVQIITSVPSLGATDIERLITFPVEAANRNIPGIKELRSFSRFGLSLVTIVFEDDVDIYLARQQVSERLQVLQSEIKPELGTPYMAPVTTGLGEIYQYVVRAKKGYEGKYSPSDLRTIQDWIVRRQLSGTPGVADVSTFGGELKQYEVAIDPDRLKSMNLSISDVFNALENNNQNAGGSYIEKGPTALYIRTEGLVKNLKDIENTVIHRKNNIPVLVRDVAKVQFGAATRYGAVTYNTEGEVTGAVVMMLKGENSSAVIKRIKQKIIQIQKTLPEGVVIEPFLDRTKMVDNAISTVETNLMEGALIVLFVLVFFLGSLRAGLIVASVIPLAMLFAIIMMNLFKVSGNLMSLGALDFGLIVDGAVIIVEAVLHRLTKARSHYHSDVITQPQLDEEVKHASSRMMNAAVFGQIIIFIVYLPVLTLRGIEGKMFGPMAQTVAFAVAGAFLLSLTYVPMMSALFLSKNTTHKLNISDRFMHWMEGLYEKTLLKALNFKKTLLLASVGFLVIAALVLSSLGGEFIPKLEEGDFAVDTRVLTGSNLKTSVQATTKASEVLLKNFPEVEKVVAKIGSGEIPTDPMPIEAADLMVILKDKSEWTSAKTFDELAEKMSKKLSAIPGISVGFQYPVQMRFNELMTGARQDVVCKLFGENLDTLSLYAQKIGSLVGTVEGAKDIYVETMNGMPQVVINYNREALVKYGLRINDINRTVNAAFAGAVAGQVYEEERSFDLVVRLNPDLKRDLHDVEKLLISLDDGTQIPLDQLASVNEINGPNQIQREDAKRRITVGFNIRGKDVETVVNELTAKVDKGIKFPPGYYVTYGGAFENLQAARKRLSIAVPLALLLIFVMLYFAFSSLSDALLIFTAIPLSAIGGVLAIWSRGMPFSISAGVGFIALFGVAVLNGIVLISEFNKLKNEGLSDLRHVVLTGSKIRLRPVLMTAAVASLGFLPMALSNGAGAEVQRPLATVVIGGLVTATLLTLLVLPVLYVIFGKQKAKKAGRKNMKKALPLLLLFLLPLTSVSQTYDQPVNLETALSLAEKNNLTLKYAAQNLKAVEKQSHTWFDVNKTNLTFEYGQINTIYNDNRFGASQTFYFPTVYKNQKMNLKELMAAVNSQAGITKIEIREAVKTLFYDIIVMQKKRELLHYADSIYSIFEQNAIRRFNAGETNILERASAEGQKQQIREQLQFLESDLNISLQAFNALLNGSGINYPTTTDFKYKMENASDTAKLNQNPRLNMFTHLMQAEHYQWKAERAKLSPDLFIGYSNMSIIGVQNVNGTERYFNSSYRFSTVSVGLGVPLFFKAQKSRSEMHHIQVEKVKIEYELEKQKLKTEFYSTLQNVIKYQNSVDLYESKGLKNADIIMESAISQFKNGEINYLEYTMLLNQSVSIKADYFTNLQQLNHSKIKLESLTNFNK